MLNATLLEVECKKAPPAGPDGDPDTPKKVNPIELVRVIASFSTRRQNLDAAHAKLKSLMKDFAEAPAGKKKDKIEGDIACEKLRVAAAEGWLKFTLKRWEIMSKFVQDNNPMTPKLKGILAFGGEEAKQGSAHLDVAGTDKPQPPLLALSFDYKNNTLNGPDGKPYGIPEVGDVVGKQKPKKDAGAAAPAPDAEPEPEPDLTMPDVKHKEPEAPDLGPGPSDADWAALDEPEPEPAASAPEPTIFDSVPAEKKEALQKLATDKALEMLKLGANPSAVVILDAMRAALVDGLPDAIINMGASDELSTLYVNALNSIKVDDADVEKINGLAAAIDIDLEQDGPVYIAGKLIAEVAEKMGKRLPNAMANDIAKQEIQRRKKAAEGYSWSDLSGDETQALIAASQKALAAAAWSSIASGTTDSGATFTSIANQAVDTSVIGKKLSPDAMTMAASFAGMALDHTLASLPDDIKDKYTDAAKAAGAAGKDPVQAIIALDEPWVLNPTGLGEIQKIAQDASPKKPDEIGFLAEVKKVFEAHPHSLGISYSDLGSVVKMGTGKYLGELASTFHIDDAHSLSDKIDKIADEVSAKKFDKGGFEAAAFAAWDKLADKVDPDHENAGKFTTLVFDNEGLDLKFKLTRRAAKVLGYGDEMSYVYELWKKWKAADDAKGKAETPVTAATTAPIPGAAPAPTKMVIPGGSNYFGAGQYGWSKFKKIFKPSHLNQNQRSYLRAKLALALQGGAMFTAAGEIGPKKLGAIAKKVQDEFKADWASAGVTQLSLDLVKDFLNQAVDLYKSNPPALWAFLPASAGATNLPEPSKSEPVVPEPEPDEEPEDDADLQHPETSITPWSDIGQATQEVITDLVAELVKTGATDIQQQIKQKYGYTLTPARISTLIDKVKSQPPAAAPEPAPEPKKLEPAAATLQDIPALHAVLAVKNPFAMTDWEKTNVLDIWKKTVGAGKPPSFKQKLSLEKFLTKCKKLLPASVDVAPITPAPTEPTETLEVEKTAPPEVYQAAGVKPRDNPLGMTYEEIKAFCALGKPVNSKTPPPEDANWKSKGSFFPGGGGAHEKYLIGTDEAGNPNEKTFKGAAPADGAWMFKPVDEAYAAGEVASNRVQALLGFSATTNAWLQEFKNQDGIMQWFTRKPSFRDQGIEHSPWIAGEKAVRQLQSYALLNFMTSEMDDHGGNFVFEDDGRLRNVDRGQAFKFFDSSHDAMDYLKWKAPAGVTHEDSKGLPKKLLNAWAAGETIPMMALTDPEFEDVIARAESIPSDLYKEMWRPYAEGAAKNGALAKWSTVPSDKTVAGFLNGVDERRKKLRASFGALYANLAKTRAAALKAKGDARPVAEIEQEIRDQIGLDEFLKGKKVKATVDPQAVAKAAESKPIEGWDDPALPTSSRLPQAAALKAAGIVGIDMMVGGNDVKDGRAQFHTVGDNAFMTVWLEPEARAKIQSRLSGLNEFTLPLPEAPVETQFVAPPAPPEMSSYTAFVNDIWGASGYTSDKMKADGTKLSKAEKHLDKWKKGTSEDPGSSQYVAKAYQKAKELATAANPIVKAVGEHYVKELLRLGEETPDGGYKLKLVDGVPEDQRSVQHFTPSAELLATQSQAAQDAQAKYEKDVEIAKQKHADAHQAKLAQFQEALKDYEKKKEEFEKKAKTMGKLPGVKIGYYPTPAEVKRDADKKVGKGSKWDGTYEVPYDGAANKMDTYDIDFTDVVTGVAVAGGGSPPTSRLLVNYVPDHVGSYGYKGDSDKKQRFPGRNGQLRIQFPANATREQMQAMIQNVAKQLDIDLKPASAQEQELNYLRRMAWLRKLEGYKTGIMHYDAEPKNGTVQDRIDFWAKKFEEGSEGPHGHSVKGLGFDPRYAVERTPGGAVKTKGGQPVYKTNPDGSRMKNPDYEPIAKDIGGGRFAYKRFDISEEEIQKYRDQGAYLSHGVSKFADAVVNAGALLANERRMKVGIRQTGMSPAADVTTGGSNEIYSWLNKSGGSNHSSFVNLDVGLLAYTSTWAHPGDHYGAKVDYGSASYNPLDRAATVQESRLVVEMMSASGFGSKPETLLGDKVDLLTWATRINVGADKRQKVIDRLKKAGITHIGPQKKPVEEVIH